MAIYIRQVFSVGSESCQKHGIFLIRRLERLRLISKIVKYLPIIFLILALWQYCDKIDDKVDLCSWAYKDEKTGATRVNPRRMMTKDDSGNLVGSSWVREKFGRNVTKQQRAVVCDVDAGQNDVEQILSCEGDSRLLIKKRV